MSELDQVVTVKACPLQPPSRAREQHALTPRRGPAFGLILLDGILPFGQRPITRRATPHPVFDQPTTKTDFAFAGSVPVATDRRPCFFRQEGHDVTAALAEKKVERANSP